MTSVPDRVFVALSDAHRRRLLEVLGGRASSSATSLAREVPVTRQAILKHLAVLYDADLVERERAGREVLYRVRSEPLIAAASWMTSVAAEWDARLAELKRRAEQPQ